MPPLRVLAFAVCLLTVSRPLCGGAVFNTYLNGEIRFLIPQGSAISISLNGYDATGCLPDKMGTGVVTACAGGGTALSLDGTALGVWIGPASGEAPSAGAYAAANSWLVSPAILVENMGANPVDMAVTISAAGTVTAAATLGYQVSAGIGISLWMDADCDLPHDGCPLAGWRTSFYSGTSGGPPSPFGLPQTLNFTVPAALFPLDQGQPIVPGKVTATAGASAGGWASSAPIPEPAPLLLLGCGLAAVALARRQRSE